MILTLELSPERERRLKAFAARQGKPETEIVEAWIDTVPEGEEVNETPQEIHARLLALGVLGHYGDPDEDAPELARHLRAEAVAMLDADIAIELLRNKAEAWNWLYSLARTPSVFTAMELLIGCRSAKERKDTLTFLASFASVFPTETGLKNAVALSRLKLSHGLSAMDALIAATALEYGLTLYTFNLRHFRAVPGLNVVVPYPR